jgi:hypothetical protein
MQTSFNQLLAAYLVELTNAHNMRNAREYPNLAALALERTGSAGYFTFEATIGKRYARVTCRRFDQEPGTGSAHCFVEITTGNIYKPAGYASPAKGVRGKLAAPKKPIFCSEFYR